MARSKRSVLPLEREAEAQVLAQRLRELADEEFVEIARLLVSKPEQQIFGDTEFELRDIVLRVGAKALEEHLRQKKRLLRMQRRLPDLSANGRVPRLPIQVPDKPAGLDHGAARVLPLPLLRWAISVGRSGRPDPEADDARSGTGGEPGRLVDGQL